MFYIIYAKCPLFLLLLLFLLLHILVIQNSYADNWTFIMDIALKLLSVVPQGSTSMRRSLVGDYACSSSAL